MADPTSLGSKLTRMALVTLGVVLVVVLVAAAFGAGWVISKRITEAAMSEVIIAAATEDIDPTRRREAMAHVDGAAKAWAAGNLTEADRLLSAAQDADSTTPGLTYQRARIAAQQARLLDASALIDRSLRNRDAVAACYRLRGEILMAQRDLPAARAALEAATKADPFGYEAYFQLAECLRMSGMTKEGVERLGEALARANKNADEFAIRLKLAIARVEAQDTEFIEKEVPSALASESYRPEYAIAAAAIALTRTDFAAAAAHLESARSRIQSDFYYWAVGDVFFNAYRDRADVAPLLMR